MPAWATEACVGDLFETGVWFRHFAATALWPHERAQYIELPPPDGPLLLALKRSRGETFPYPRLLESMTSYYSCGFGPTGLASCGVQGFRQLADRLSEVGRAFDAVRLGPLDRAGPFAQACEQALGAHGLRTFWALAYRNWFADTAGLSYGDYLQRVPSSFPGTSEKRRQAFLRKGIGSISIADSELDLNEHIDAYQRVYAESWKVPEPFPHFMPGLIRLAAQRGQLRLGVARVGGEPAAAQLWFVVEGRALIYKVAYVERFSKLSVGSILSCALFDHVLSVDRVREIDFLSGDDAYKAKWMLARRDRHTLLAFNPWRWRGLLGAVREGLAQRRDRSAAAAAPERAGAGS